MLYIQDFTNNAIKLQLFIDKIFAYIPSLKRTFLTLINIYSRRLLLSVLPGCHWLQWRSRDQTLPNFQNNAHMRYDKLTEAVS